jgi:hypothetical protein
MDQKTSLVDQAEEFVKNFDHDISRVSSAQNKSKLNKSK